MGKVRKKPKEEKRIIPQHFATFGDIMLNLLTLFILLCTFAREKRAELFAAGVGSFIEALETKGLPGLLNADTKTIVLGQFERKFLCPPPDEDAEDGKESSYDMVEKIELEMMEERGEAWIPGAVQFRRGSTRLDSEAVVWLREQAVLLRERESDGEIAGYAWSECMGNEQAAWDLSLKRAYRVMSYLNEAEGIPIERMHAVGYGNFRPIAEGDRDPVLNRRVNIKLTKSDK